MLLDLYDKGISRDLICDSVREPYLTRMVKENLKPEDVVFDIGANIGYYALIESHKVGEYGKVFAIEPVRSNLNLLEKNVEINKILSPFPQRYEVEVYKYAIGSEIKEVSVNVSKMRNLCAIGERRDSDTIENVEMVTLDYFAEVVKVYPMAIRMDVEGYEYEIIKGMGDILKDRSIPLKIFMELHCDILLEKQKEMCETLKFYGFKVKQASFEPHPCVQRHKWALPILSFFDSRLGADTGLLDIAIDDLINDKRYFNGDVEVIEVLFDRS
jgi:FkbM family methyltransferase